MIAWTAAHPRSAPYAGPRVGCSYCAYEAEGPRGPAPRIAHATRLVETKKGPRELCDHHAGALDGGQ